MARAFAARTLRRRLLRGLINLPAIAALVATPTVATADVSSAMNDYFNDAGGAANVTGPTAFNGQSAGYYSMGNVWTRFPQRSIQPFNLQLPNARAGCGGIDLFAGSFSFINAAELVAMFKATANNALGFAFKLAIDSISPQISKVMEDLSQKVQQLNQMNINSCETAQALVGGLWPQQEATRNTICTSIGNSQGIFSDWAAARQGCNNGGRRDSTIAANSDPAMAEQLVGEKHNFTWDILKKSPQFSGLSSEFREYIMSLVGTIITVPSTDPSVGAKIAIIGPGDDTLMTAVLDGTSATPVRILRCDESDLCLNPTAQTLTIANPIKPRVRQLIVNMVDAIATDGAIGSEEKSLLNVTSIPLYKILTVQAAAKVRLTEGEIDTLAEFVAVDFVLSMFQNLLDRVNSVQTSLTKADQESASMWRQQIADARKRLSERSTQVAERVSKTQFVVDRAAKLETTLQNQMSPQMRSALRFARGMNAQGVVQ